MMNQGSTSQRFNKLIEQRFNSITKTLDSEALTYVEVRGQSYMELSFDVSIHNTDIENYLFDQGFEAKHWSMKPYVYRLTIPYFRYRRPERIALALANIDSFTAYSETKPDRENSKTGPFRGGMRLIIYDNISDAAGKILMQYGFVKAPMSRNRYIKYVPIIKKQYSKYRNQSEVQQPCL